MSKTGGGSMWWGSIALLVLTIGLVAPFDTLHTALQRTFALLFFALICWTTEPVPLEFSSLVLLLLFPACGLLSFEASFAALAGPTIWIVYAGMILSAAIEQSELVEVVARFTTRYFGDSVLRLLIFLHILGLTAALLIPSGVVRVLLLMPVGIAIARSLKAERDPLLTPTIIIALMCSTLYSGFGILTGAVPNLVIAGQFERVTGQTIFWGQWLSLMFPVLGFLRTGICLFVIWILFGRHLLPLSHLSASGPTPKPRLTHMQFRVLCIVVGAVFFWALDAFHGIPPVFVGLVAVLAVVTPRYGAMPASLLRQANFPFFFYLTALFALAATMEASGFNNFCLEIVLPLLNETKTWSVEFRYLTVTMVVLPLNFLMDVAAVAGLVTPVLIEWGQDNQLPALPIALSVAMATCQIYIPYQSAPFMVAYSSGRLSMWQLTKPMLLISLLTCGLLCPLNVLFWSWHGGL